MSTMMMSYAKALGSKSKTLTMRREDKEKEAKADCSWMWISSATEIYFLPDEKRVIILRYMNDALVCNIDSSTGVMSMGEKFPVTRPLGMAVMSDGKVAACSHNGGGISFFSLTDRPMRLIRKIERGIIFKTIVFYSSNGNIACLDTHGELVIFPFSPQFDSVLVRMHHNHRLWTLDHSPDGKWLLCVNDQEIVIYSVKNDGLPSVHNIIPINIPKSPDLIASYFANDSLSVIVGNREEFRQFSLVGDIWTYVSTKVNSEWNTVCFYPDGQLVTTIERSPVLVQTLTLDLKSNTFFHPHSESKSESESESDMWAIPDSTSFLKPKSLTFSPNGTLALLAFPQGIRILDVDEQLRLRPITGGILTKVQTSRTICNELIRWCSESRCIPLDMVRLLLGYLTPYLHLHPDTCTTTIVNK